jgi:hypothetical protein
MISARKAKRKFPMFGQDDWTGCRKLVVDGKEYFMKGDLWELEHAQLTKAIFGSVFGQIQSYAGGGLCAQQDGNKLLIGPAIPGAEEITAKVDLGKSKVDEWAF